MMSGQERRYLDHNPAGAAMIVAMLVALSGTAFTGWLLEEPGRVAMLPEMPQIVAPAQADEDGGEYGERGKDEGALKDIHGALANLMLLLAGLHVGGVVLASVRHHENLLEPWSLATSTPPVTATSPDLQEPRGRPSLRPHLAPPSPAGPFLS